MDRLRELTEWRKRMVNPVSEIMEKCVREQYSEEEDEHWYGPETWHQLSIACNPSDAMYHLVNYGEMYGAGMREWLESNAESKVPSSVKTVRVSIILITKNVQ